LGIKTQMTGAVTATFQQKPAGVEQLEELIQNIE
jgi:hypothetical protein